MKIDSSWTLFLDRDGVINRRIVGGYVRKWEEFEFLPGVKEAMAVFAGIFGRIIVVSNQQGVGKGLMTTEEVETIHRQMQKEIETAGGRIDAVYFCPALEREGSIFRKPNVGMGLKARKEYAEIRFKRSVMAGDSISDMVFGKRLGMKTVFTGNDMKAIAMHDSEVDFVFPDIFTYAQIISPRRHGDTV